MKSLTHSWFGRCALNWRLTRSSGHGAFASATVVRTTLPLMTPRRPAFPPERRRAYDVPVIREWLIVFVKRFFGFAQFKRSAMPNGPKVSHGGSLSPRGDWRAPSDGNAAVWLADIEQNIPTERADNR